MKYHYCRSIPCLFIFVLLFCANDLMAQQLTIRTMSLKPVPDVIVFNVDKSFYARSDENGSLTVEGVSKSDTLFFQHPAYFRLTFTLDEIAQRGYKITMTEKVLVMNEYVVAASKIREKAEVTAHQVDVIDVKEIEFNNSQTSAHVLEQSCKVFVQRSQMGGGSPVIRGLEANKVLLVVDGVRLNNAIYRGEHLQNVITIDSEMLDRIEVVQGPGSLIYGSDALGGVMHFFTRQPRLSSDETTRVDGNALLRYASANFEKKTHVNFNFGKKKFASLTGITFTDFDDLRTGSRQNPFYGDYGKHLEYVARINGKDTIIQNPNPLVQKFTGYRQFDAIQKFLVMARETKLIFNFQFSSGSNISRYEFLRETKTVSVTEPLHVFVYEDTIIQIDTTYEAELPRWARWEYGPQTRFLGSLEVALKKDKKFYDDATLIIAYQKVLEERISRRFGETEQFSRKENVDILTLNFDLVKKLDRQNSVQYGFEGAFNHVRSSAELLDIETNEIQPASTRYPENGSHLQTYAFYARYNLNISDKVIVNTGFRYSHVFLNSKFGDNRFFEVQFNDIRFDNAAFSGMFAVVYNPGKQWHINMILSSGYRVPNLDDAVKVSNLETNPEANRVLVPNASLKPEYVYSAEAGIRRRFEDKVSAELVFYNTLIRNAIRVQPFSVNGFDHITFDGELSSVNTNVNIGQAVIRGVSFNFSADINRHFSVTNTFNYTYGRNKTDDVPLDHIPPFYGQTGLHTLYKNFRGEVALRYNGWKRAEDYAPIGNDNLINATEFGAPAWFTLNVRTEYQFNRFFRVQVAVENILDRHYRTFSSGVSAPGINFILAARVNF